MSSVPTLNGGANFPPQQATFSPGLPLDVCAKMVTVRDDRKEGTHTCNKLAATSTCSQSSFSPWTCLRLLAEIHTFGFLNLCLFWRRLIHASSYVVADPLISGLHCKLYALVPPYSCSQLLVYPHKIQRSISKRRNNNFVPSANVALVWTSFTMHFC